MESESSFEQGDLFWLALQDIHPSDWERKGQMGNSQEAPFIPTQDIEGTSCREDVLRCPEEGLGCDRPGRFEAPDFEAGGSRASHGERKPCRPVDASLAPTRLGQWDDAMQPGRVERQRNRRTRRGRDAPWKELKGEKKELQATWPEDAGACCRSFQSRTPVLCRSPILHNPCQRRGRSFFCSGGVQLAVPARTESQPTCRLPSSGFNLC
jgi:hypothetical protein